MLRRLGQLFTLVLLCCAVLIGVSLQQFYRYQWQKPAKDAVEVSFTVASGESIRSVAERLKEDGYIANAFWFRMTAGFAGLADDVKAGSTSFLPGDRYADILQALMYPSGAAEVSVTIPEGYTIAQIGEVVRAQIPSISVEEWEQATGMTSPLENHPLIIRSDKPENVDLEGYLFPDTYRFFATAQAEDVVSVMIDTMERRIEALGELKGDAAGMTLHEAITLASIVEREVRRSEEMREVADIFLKRLEIGMALQADSTVNYVTGGKDPSISFAETELDSPYNTYQNAGLPPGPISNPGMNALRAVFDPAENPYFYFLTDPLGKVYYAETFDQHIDNRQYLD